MTENAVKVKEKSNRDEYVLRRGVAISDRYLLSERGEDLAFGHNDIIIPVSTLDEIRCYHDKSQKMMIAAQFIESLSQIEKEAFSERGYRRKNGSYIKIVDCKKISKEVKACHSLDLYAQRTLQVCLDRIEAKKMAGDSGKVILVTSNISLRKAANDLGIDAKEYEDKLYPSLKDQYKGIIKVEASGDVVATLMGERKCVSVTEINNSETYKWHPNEFVQICSMDQVSNKALGRYFNGKILPIRNLEATVCNISGKNMEQKFFIEALLTDPEQAPLVIGKGSAGVGKTYLALASALEQLNLDSYLAQIASSMRDDDEDTKTSSFDDNGTQQKNGKKKRTVKDTPTVNPKIIFGKKEGMFDRILISTPQVTISNEEYGFLPGGIDNKTAPYYGGIFDNLVKIIRQKYPELSLYDVESAANEMIYRKIIQIVPIGFMRGRSFENVCLILDEAQNVDPTDVLDIISRPGKGTRIIIIGDPNQVNKVGLSKKCNGIVYATEGMKDFQGCYVVTFDDTKIQRSSLAMYAVQKLL